VVAAQTRLSMVDGARGVLVICGKRIEDVAPAQTFEATVAMLWECAGLGDAKEAVAALPQFRTLPHHTLSLLQAAARDKVEVMDALRMGAASLHAGNDRDAAIQLVAAFPTIVAAYWRALQGKEPIPPREHLGHASNYLFMLTGEEPHADMVRGLETYLNTVVDHGLNASTFTARVIASTGSDFVSAITGAAGALKGPLHGGAPGPALDMVFEIGDSSRSEVVLRKKLASGERLMGFGHRVYKVRDPRADVLAAAAERMFQRAGDERKLYDLARSVEQTALRLLEEYKPGRKLQTNVEFYTALVLHGVGLEVPLFTPTFAVSRVAGWVAHCFEQRKAGKLIRPQSVYVGPIPD
jgi:citrate synthase